MAGDCDINSSAQEGARADMHIVTRIAWKENHLRLAHQSEVVQFRVHDTGGVRGDYLDVYPGVVRPSLEWQTKSPTGP